MHIFLCKCVYIYIYIIYYILYIYYLYNTAVLIKICRFWINVVKFTQTLTKLDLPTLRKGSIEEYIYIYYIYIYVCIYYIYIIYHIYYIYYIYILYYHILYIIYIYIIYAYIYIYIISRRSITPQHIKHSSKSLDVVQSLYFGSKLPSSGTYK